MRQDVFSRAYTIFIDEQSVLEIIGLLCVEVTKTGDATWNCTEDVAKIEK